MNLPFFSLFLLPFLWSIELKDWLADDVYKSVSVGREQWFGSVHFSGPCDLKVLSAVLGSNIDRLTHRNTHTHLNAQSEHTLHKTTPPGKRYRTNLSRSCQASQTCTKVCVWQEALIMSPMPQEICLFLSLALSCSIVHTLELPSIHPSHQQTLKQWRRSTTMSFDLFKSPTNQKKKKRKELNKEELHTNLWKEMILVLWCLCVLQANNGLYYPEIKVNLYDQLNRHPTVSFIWLQIHRNTAFVDLKNTCSVFSTIHYHGREEAISIMPWKQWFVSIIK